MSDLQEFLAAAFFGLFVISSMAALIAILIVVFTAEIANVIERR